MTSEIVDLENMPKLMRSKSRVSRADLLWSFDSIDDNQHQQIAEILGFEKIEETSPTFPRKDYKHRQFSFNEDEVEVEVDATNMNSNVEDESPQSAAKNSSYYRILSRSIDQTNQHAKNVEQSLPDWFTQASPTLLKETTTRIPKIHQVKPLYSELTTWPRLLPFLQRIFGNRVEGRRLDTIRLVKLTAQCEMISKIPRKQRFYWATKARILVDINDRNFPYRRDFLYLRDQLIRIRGDEGLEVQYVYDEPGGYIARYEQQQEVIEHWRLPESDTPILILSDLGMHSKSRKELYAWLVFGQILNVQGFRPVVLMPVAERDIDTRLLKYFDCVVWDRISHLKRVKGDYQNENDICSHPESIDQLLSYFFAAVRVDSGLLRAVRHLLPSAYDIGHEAALWRHAAVIHEGDEWGWLAGVKSHYSLKAEMLLKALSPGQKQKLVELIGRYHAQYPDALYFEAMYALKLLGLPLPQEVETVTEKFIQDLVKTYSENLDKSLLHDWVKRHLVRHEAPVIRQKHEYWRPFMAFVTRCDEQYNASAKKEWPDDLTQADIAEVLCFMNASQLEHTYHLRQYAEKLVLMPATSMKQTASLDEWESNEQGGGILLLTLNLTDTHIFHCHTDSQGKQQIVSLNLAQAVDQTFQFTSIGQHSFYIGRECLIIDVTTIHQRKEIWMACVGVGSEGFYAESRNQKNQVHRWYWHPPEWGTDESLLPGFWYDQPVSVDTLKPDWATDAGQDQYGFYADIQIFNTTQRFRWIVPANFLMGSPEDEVGRDDNETLHAVILTRGYWLADTACTQALWKAMMHDNASHYKGENLPVENVNWSDIQDFIEKLNKLNPELKLRLPTEAEWENACRAGASGVFNFEDELSLDKVNYRGTWEYKSDEWGEGAMQQTVDVKTEKYQPNAWGLHQMHGNVWEWCQDWFADYTTETVIDPQGANNGVSRVLRGGSWGTVGGGCRSACRIRYGPFERIYGAGFRLARDHELKPVRTVRAGQQPTGSRAGGARGGQVGSGLRTRDSRKKPK